MTRTRVPQEERTRITRERILNAAVDCLVEHGWRGTTTTVVADRAGVSRGAQLHHYPTRDSLLTAAIEHLSSRRLAAVSADAPDTDQDLDVRKALDHLSKYFTSDLFGAALELWTAARTDPDLRALVVPLERVIGRQTHGLAVRLLDVDESLPGNRELIQATLDLFRGLALAQTVNDDSRRRAHILDRWASVLENELLRPPVTRSSQSPPRTAAAELQNAADQRP